jgi:transcriptional regulator with XRE-family HTH domain
MVSARVFEPETCHAEVEEDNDMWRKNITGRQVAYWRNQNRWTQKTLSARLECLGFGISREMVANIEAGLRGVEDNWLVGFQKVFRLPVIRFFPQEIQDADAEFGKRAPAPLPDPKPSKKPRRKCQKLTKKRPPI